MHTVKIYISLYDRRISVLGSGKVKRIHILKERKKERKKDKKDRDILTFLVKFWYVPKRGEIKKN
jgi:hypothetical protein